MDFASNALQMELKACIEGTCAGEPGLETDALVVWALQGDDYRLSSIGGLVHELKKLLAENFVVYQVQYMPPRECNLVAH